ncbi:hypothetical protein AK812_SmicGene41051 [Symbiodinium microadriaticum]|uniref:Uncharacterized protein n=1 Tax=Symbiodinium microadriaticum TaxID=2951 RepID=A0A1Q9C735_SYMMI|nr:hypothetical protein AK812_SmicGene41051 [Symbiodinium microadriaticum]
MQPQEARERLQEVAFENVPAMDDEGENEFVSEQVNEIVKNAITKSQYSKERVVTCIIMQKSGAPLHTALHDLRSLCEDFEKEELTDDPESKAVDEEDPEVVIRL